MNPTFRPPRVIPPKKSTSPAAATSPPVSPQAQVAPDVLMAALRALGIGEDLLRQIQTSIKPPAPKVERKERGLMLAIGGVCNEPSTEGRRTGCSSGRI